MALLGLFSKRDKSKSSRSTTPSKSTASEVDSAETDYVLPNAHNTPAAPNGFYNNPGASSSKIRLGFGHKKSSQTVMSDSPRLQPPLVHSPTSAMSDGDLHSLRPPLSKSALFSAYSDSPGAHSTRSLPTKPSHSRNNSRDIAQSVDGHSNNDTPNSEKDRKGRNDKKGGFLAWARGRSKSKPPPPPPELSVDLSAASFNLKSFRHVGSDSPVVEVPRPPSALSSPFNTPPVRPRGNSVASDNSQRISVAVFREMAARQRPNSPGPAFRPPSRTELSSRFETSSPSPVASRRPGVPSPNITPSTTRSSTALALQSDSTSDEDSDSEESESEESGGSATLRPKRNRTITQRSASKATSELGHRSRASTTTSTPVRATRSNLGHGDGISPISSPISPPASAPRESRPSSIYARNRASASMSALQPNAAARRASLRVAPRAPIPVSRPSMAQSSSDSSDSDSDDSDNAPLSRLVAPKRPGSAASSATSGSRARVPAKPLIDISGMNPPTLPPLPAFETSAPEKQEVVAPSTPTSPTSINSEKLTLADRLARAARADGPKSKENLILRSAGSDRRTSLDYLNFTDSDKKDGDEKAAQKPIPQPTRSQTAPMNSLEPLSTSSSAPMKINLKLKPNGRSMSSPNAAAPPVDLTDPKPIHPIPIRERSPPPAFSVTSRPTSQVSSSSNPRHSASFNDAIPTIRAIGLSSSPSSPPDRSKMPAPTSALTPRNNPTLKNPPPRISSMNAPNVLIPDTAKPAAKGFTGGGLLSTPSAIPKDPKMRARQRSSTMIDPKSSPIASRSDNMSVYSRSSKNLNTLVPSPTGGAPPLKPFAADNSTRGNSPGSSTASSSRLPLTPGEGSEIGYGRKIVSSDSSASGVSSSNASSPIAPKKGHRKSSSLTFDEPSKDRGRPGSKDRMQKEVPQNEEARRRERRRSEAKAAVELGNIVNGRGPMIADDDDEDVPLSSMPPRMSMMNPMVNFTPPTPITWQAPNNMMNSMPSPQGMMFPVPPPNADPAYLAAHQQAMMIAKQAYQMAVAQQAMAQANEEWERGSTATSAYGGFGGMSNMSSVGGMTGMGGMGGMNGMGGMGNMGMGMFPGQFGMPGWTGSMMFPNSAQSMYAGSVMGSELGINGGWGSQSVYGGPGDRSSRMFSGGGGNSGGSVVGGFSSSRSDAFGPTSSRPGPRPRTKTAPSDGNLPTQHARSRATAPPPSSWKKGPQRGM